MFLWFCSTVLSVDEKSYMVRLSLKRDSRSPNSPNLWFPVYDLAICVSTYLFSIKVCESSSKSKKLKADIEHDHWRHYRWHSAILRLFFSAGDLGFDKCYEITKTTMISAIEIHLQFNLIFYFVEKSWLQLFLPIKLFNVWFPLKGSTYLTNLQLKASGLGMYVWPLRRNTASKG